MSLSTNKCLLKLHLQAGAVNSAAPLKPALCRKSMTPADLDAMRARIRRAFDAVSCAEGKGYQQSYETAATDFTTTFRAIGVKVPEQLQDDFLTLFVWVWSLKDYLKLALIERGPPGRSFEDEVNRCSSLTYVADVVNRTKHGSLRESRSGEFAELVDVGQVVPQEAIERIVVAGPEVTVHVKDPQKVVLRATVVTSGGARVDALPFPMKPCIIGKPMLSLGLRHNLPSDTDARQRPLPPVAPVTGCRSLSLDV